MSVQLSPSPPLTLCLDPIVELNDEQLFELCRRNRDLRIERNSTGEIVLMVPAGGETSGRNAAITGQLWYWALQNGRGQVFDSSGGFILPNGAMRAPDAAWVELERLQALSGETRKRFLPICPTFVVELRSPSDTMESLREKMREYLDNGTRLGWLVDPVQRRLEVYRPGSEVEVLGEPASVSGDPELPGLVLDLERVWSLPW